MHVVRHWFSFSESIKAAYVNVALIKYSFVQLHLKPIGIYLHVDREFPGQSDCVAATKQLPCINWWEFLHPKKRKHIQTIDSQQQKFAFLYFVLIFPN